MKEEGTMVIESLEGLASMAKEAGAMDEKPYTIIDSVREDR